MSEETLDITNDAQNLILGVVRELAVRSRISDVKPRLHQPPLRLCVAP